MEAGAAVADVVHALNDVRTKLVTSARSISTCESTLQELAKHKVPAGGANTSGGAATRAEHDPIITMEAVRVALRRLGLW